jgi:hypothetical protein
MIWKIHKIDRTFIESWIQAGEPDQAIIDRYVQRHGQHAPAARLAGEPRYYYLHALEPRITLRTVSLPLEAWQGGAKIIIGTQRIIGEFAGNRHLVGQRGLALKMEPVDLLYGKPDDEFSDGMSMLAELSSQILDRDALKRYEQREERWRNRQRGR